MPIGAIIGAGASIIGGLLGSHGAKSAAQQQIDAANAAKSQILNAGSTAATNVTNAGEGGRDSLLNVANTGNADIHGTLDNFTPYIQAGSTAAPQVTDLTSAPVSKFSFDPSTLGMDPGYLFRKAEADKTQIQNAAALGSVESGGFAKALSDRNSADASQEVANQYQRQLSTFNTNEGTNNTRIQQLMAIMGLGDTASQQTTQGSIAGDQLALTGADEGQKMNLAGVTQAGMFNTGAANKAGDLTVGAGQAGAAGTVGQTNALTGMLGNLTNGIDWSSIFKKSPATPNTSVQPYALGA